MYDKINECNDPSLTNVLLKLFSLYGLYSVEKYLITFYQGGFIEGASATNLIQNAILQLIKDLKDDAIALVDAVAPPDAILNSVLGKSDGQVINKQILLVIYYFICYNAGIQTFTRKII